MSQSRTPRHRAAIRRSILNTIRPELPLRAAFFEPLETRTMLSVAPTFWPATPSSGYYGSLIQSPKPAFVGPTHPTPTGGPDAPSLITTIPGITFDEDGANNSGAFTVPADPHGAAGPTHLVSVVNRSIEFHTKGGVQQFSDDLAGFFATLAPVGKPFDPKVIYDSYNQRFVVVALERTDTTQGGASNTSHIMVAVSDDSDPNGTWTYHSINSAISIGGQLRWADFPGVGVDGSAVYITANMFTYGATPTFGGSRLWIVNKTPFYSGGAATVTVHDPSTAAGLPAQAATLQPAKMIGTVPANMGTFIVSNSITFGVNESMSVIRITNPVTAPAFSNTFVSLGDINNESVAFPDAPQSGSATLVDTGNALTLDAVWRNNAVYVAFSVNPKASVDAVNAGQATAHWVKVNASGVSAPSLADQGNIGGEELGTGTHTFFPSIAVNTAGDVGIGLSASSASIFVGAYYTARGNGAPAGTVQPLGTLAAGLAPYVRTFGVTNNRWGDYSATVIDPADDSVWLFNAYADTQGTPTNPPPEDGRWATRWGNFTLTAVTPPIPGTPDLLASSDSGSSDTDDITNDSTPTFFVTGQDGLTIKIFANGLLVGSNVVAGGFTLVTTSLLTDGLKTITAVQSDGVNDSAPSPALPVTIDTVAPALSGTPTFNYLGPTVLHSVVYFFTESVLSSLSTSDLIVTRLPSIVEPTSLAYVGGLNPATFTFPSASNAGLTGILPDGNYEAVLTGSSIFDVAGNAMTSNSTLPFFFMQADANHDRFVNGIDFSILSGNFNQTGRNFAQANFNYDGVVNGLDFAILSGRFNRNLPAAPPTIAGRTGPCAAASVDEDVLRSLLA